MKLAQQAEHDFFILRIQISRRFIRQDDSRIVDQRAGNAHPLLLAARELRRQMVRAISQADSRKSLHRFLFVGHAVKVLREHYVLDRGEKGNEMKLLEDKTNLLGAHAV